MKGIIYIVKFPLKDSFEDYKYFANCRKEINILANEINMIDK
jgi:hypothetical protein